MSDLAEPMAAAAALDPEGGRLIGFALGEGGRPARIEVTLDGVLALSRLAAAPVERLGPDGVSLLGVAPPTAICAFEARLGPGARGRRMEARVAGQSAALLVVEFETDRALAPYREGSTMADRVALSGLRFRSGRFRAEVAADAAGAAPKIELRVRGEIVGLAKLAPRAGGGYDLSADAPLDALSDGVAMLDFACEDGSVLATYPIAAGAALAGDMAAEVASLRTELDQLKKAVRAAIGSGVLTRDERPMIIAETLTEVDNLLEMRDRADRDALRGAEAGDADWDDDAAFWDIDE